jgi:colanic acid biosynthesis protein WcaH
MSVELGRSDFLEVVRHTPLVSIDLIVRQPSGACLVGCRRNPPARGWWFVPGGRIRKNEPIPEAFRRISETELGTPAELADARFLGVFEHLYDDNAGELAGFGTHYVVLAFELPWDDRELPSPDPQHDRFRWSDPAAILADPDVHPNTRAYFAPDAGPIAGPVPRHR